MRIPQAKVIGGVERSRRRLRFFRLQNLVAAMGAMAILSLAYEHYFNGAPALLAAVMTFNLTAFCSMGIRSLNRIEAERAAREVDRLGEAHRAQVAREAALLDKAHRAQVARAQRELELDSAMVRRIIRDTAPDTLDRIRSAAGREMIDRVLRQPTKGDTTWQETKSSKNLN